MDRVRLELGFMDSSNKKFRISIDDPIEELDKEDIEGAMESLINHNIFTSDGKDLVGLDSARIIRTSTEEIEF